MRNGVSNCAKELKGFDVCSSQFWELLAQPKVVEALTHLKRSEEECGSLRRDLQTVTPLHSMYSTNALLVRSRGDRKHAESER